MDIFIMSKLIKHAMISSLCIGDIYGCTCTNVTCVFGCVV